MSPTYRQLQEDASCTVLLLEKLVQVSPMPPNGQDQLRLQALDHQLQKLPRSASKRIHTFRILRTRQGGGENVLAAQGDRQAGERHGRQQAVMVDLAQPWTAVLVLGEEAVVLDAEAPDLLGTLLDVGDRVHAEIVHYVAGVVVDLDALVSDLADDLGTGGAGAGLAAMLLDDDAHALVASDGAQLLEALDP